MNLATTYTRAPLSMHAPLVRVEVHLASGLPAMTLVGLPEKAVKESKDRVRAAILNSGFEFPAKHITINLAPAELPKDGARYDLAIALGILAASGQIPPDATAAHEYHGELALSGQLRPVSGILPCALAATDAHRDIITAPENHHEAALVAADNTHSAGSLAEIAAILHGQRDWPAPPAAVLRPPRQYPDYSDVIGQHQAKRALLVAAAGGHHVLMSGPPGTGKSMLAQRFPGILPAMNDAEAIESAARLPEAASTPPTGGSAPTARHTTAAPPPRWLAAAPSPNRAKSALPTTASSFSTNCPNSTAASLKCCANRWKTATSPSAAPR